MKVATVNVIKYIGDSVYHIAAFSEDAEGNQEAEEEFDSIVRELEPSVTEEELAGFKDDGYYETGIYQVFITHAHTD